MPFNHILPKPGLSEEGKLTPDEKQKLETRRKLDDSKVNKPINAMPSQWHCACGQKVFAHISSCPHCGEFQPLKKDA